MIKKFLFMLLLIFSVGAIVYIKSAFGVGVPSLLNSSKVNGAFERTTTQNKSSQKKEPVTKLFPVDEGKKDLSFSQFRDDLLTIIRERNYLSLKEIIDEKIINNLGGGGGIEQFEEQWQPRKKNSQLWRELETVLKLGGEFIDTESSNKAFCAPYTYSSWIKIANDFVHSGEEYFAFVIAPRVELKTKPSIDSKSITELSYDIVHLDNGNDENTKEWLKVTTIDGKKGFVEKKHIREPADFRACFEFKNQQWKMTELIAGD